jgi:hypothetical protein
MRVLADNNSRGKLDHQRLASKVKPILALSHHGW